MAYESSYGRGANQEPSYFDTGGTASDYSSTRSAEPRDKSASNARHQSLPHDKMTSSPERKESAGFDNVSSELIAEITERVKRELVEHLNRTGNVEEQPKAPSMQRQPSDRSHKSYQSNKSNSTSSPPPTVRSVYTPPLPTLTQPQPPKPASVPPQMAPMESAKGPFRSPPHSPLAKPSGASVRFSERTPAIRPQPGRVPTMELSTVDQKWGRLFDNEGQATQRLGEFLRGLANHIIDQFKPEKSIVITPDKMAILYASHPLEQEPNQLLSIFRTGPSEQISRFYRDLGCQHHLIQDNSNDTPAIPALTPLGFAQWMTINILAYPDEESKRLDKVVLAMPIDADGQMVDGKPERLPKQISRHLLPGREDRNMRKLLNKAVSDFLADLGSANRRKASMTSAPPLSRNSSISQPRPHPIEIHQVRIPPTTSKAQPTERASYPPPPKTESPTIEEPVRIERDRQPYTAQPGGTGKVYNENISMNIPKLNRTISSNHSRETEPAETRETRHHRTRSNASQNPCNPGSRPGGRRTSSPPLKKYSDSTPIGLDIPGSKFGLGPSSTTSSFTSHSQPNTFPPPPPPPIDIRERDRSSERHYRSGTDDEPRFTGDFNSPKEAEKWDRYNDAREADQRSYERGSVSVDPRDTRGSVSGDPRSSDPRDTREARRDSRGAAYEDWYRDIPRGTAYEAYPRY